MLADDDRRKAIHESGHVLAAFCLSDPGHEPFHEISLFPKDGLQAHIVRNQHYTWGDGRDGCEREVMVLLGGTVAEELVYGNALGAVDDMDEIEVLLADWIEDTSPESSEMRSYLDTLCGRLKNELANHVNWRRALDRLADELITQRTILYKEAVELLSRELSTIR